MISSYSERNSYRTGEGKLEFHTCIQFISWDTWRQRVGVSTHPSDTWLPGYFEDVLTWGSWQINALDYVEH